MSPNFKMVILVSGRGSNMTAILQALKDQKLQGTVECVISNKADAQALKTAQDFGVPTQVIESKGKSSSEFQDQIFNTLKDHNPDLVVLAGFMRILSQSTVKAFEGKIINIHPSLLPKFPGLNAHQQALDAKESITGCTVHYVDEGCDTGPILLQKSEPILPNDTVDTLSKRLLNKEHECLIEAIQTIQNQHLNKH